MRHLPLALLAALVVSGCTADGNGQRTGKTDSDGNVEGDQDQPITTRKDLALQKRRVLQLLEVFEGRSQAEMEEACLELEEIGKPLVSDEILAQIERFRKPQTLHAALDRLRWLSQLARAFDNLDTADKELWQRVKKSVLRLGDEATVRFVTVLIVKMPTAPAGWCRAMLMDVCVEKGDVAHEAILTALNFKGTEQESALTERVMDDNVRAGCASALLFLPDPPVTKIRASAKSGPISTRRAWAKLLPARKSKDRQTGDEFATPWAVEILAAQLLEDPEWQVRADAALGLGEANDSATAVPALATALKDTDHWVRRNICLSLGRYGGLARDALPELAKAAKLFMDEKIEGNPRRELSQALYFAFQKITGKHFEDLGTYVAYSEESMRK
jgi:hypothetical protein